MRLVLGGAFGGFPLDFFGLGDTESFNIAILISDLSDCVRNNGEAHVTHVFTNQVENLSGKGGTVTIELLDGKNANNSTLVSCNGLLDSVLDLIVPLADKVLGREANGELINLEVAVGDVGALRGVVAFLRDRPALDFDLAARGDVDADAVLGGAADGLDGDGAQLEAERVDALDDGDGEYAAADDDAHLPAARRLDQGGVRTGRVHAELAEDHGGRGVVVTLRGCGIRDAVLGCGKKMRDCVRRETKMVVERGGEVRGGRV